MDVFNNRKPEIGSEFWDADYTNHENELFKNDFSYISGRTIIDLIIKDILSKSQIKAVMLPDYLCSSMIEPFQRNNIKIKYYHVFFDNKGIDFHLDENEDYDVILTMSYFGYQNKNTLKLIEFSKKNNKIVIEDATHSIFSDNSYSSASDYVFTSLRKWTGINSGGEIVKCPQSFRGNKNLIIDVEYSRIKQGAKDLKKEYILNGKGNKQEFLKLFQESEKYLENNYENKIVFSAKKNKAQYLDVNKIKDKRRENAMYLHKQLKGFSDLKLFEINKGDTPLFVPIFLAQSLRDSLYKELIKLNIYCPIHWPKPSQISNKTNKLYDQQISIVCDQRYDLNDMKIIVQYVKQIIGDDNVTNNQLA